jgi:uncharacterized repeat protein (TIGR03803 family)
MLRTDSLKIVGALLLGAWSCGLGSLAVAQTTQMTVLTNFDGGNGGNPAAWLTLAPDGNFYGTTIQRDVSYGTIFRLTTNGIMMPLFFFPPTVTNSVNLTTNDTGYLPDGALTVGPDGNLYGTAARGGIYGYGTVFKITTNDSFSLLTSFNGTNGALPEGALTLGPDGNLYGTTVNGGSNNVGTVFRITTNGTLTSLFSFAAAAANGDANSTGDKPSGGLVLKPGGVFYGTTVFGGTGGYGEFFRITTNGAFTPLFSFGPEASNGSTETNDIGAEPGFNLVPGPDGDFYGAALYGGTNGGGTLFKLTTNGTFTLLHTMNGPANNSTDGSQPQGPFTLGPDGNFYGAASNGGSGGQGTLFRLTPGGAFTLLFTFDPLVSGTNATGGEPLPLTLGNDGNFYSLTYWGGTNGFGTIFKFSVAPTLNIQWLSGKAVLTWTNSAGSLQSAPAVTGTYTNVPNASSPFTNALNVPAQFFRLIGN